MVKKKSDVEITLGNVVEFTESGGLKRLERANTKDGGLRIRCARLRRTLKREYDVYSDEVTTLVKELEGKYALDSSGRQIIKFKVTANLDIYQNTLSEMHEQSVLLESRCVLTEQQIVALDGPDIGDVDTLMEWFEDNASEVEDDDESAPC